VPEQVGAQALEERDGEAGGEEAELLEHGQGDSHERRGEPLKEQLGAGGEPQAAALDHLDVVVDKADGCEGERGEDGDPDKRIGGDGPEHGGHENGNDDEDAAHGWSAGFLEVRLGAIFADELADLKFVQLLDHPGADKQSDEQRRERGKGGAKREEAEDAKGVKKRIQLFVEQPVKQVASRAGAGRDSG